MSRVPAANHIQPELYCIEKRKPELSDTFTLQLRPATVSDAMVFEPGQFNMLYVFGIGEIPISISGDPEQPQRLIHTVRAVGAVTQAMQKLRRDDTLGVRGPFGSGWPVAQVAGDDIVIMAGGLGLAPLRPLIYQVLANRSRYGNFCIFYGARTPDDMLYLQELKQWRGRFDMTVEATVDRAPGDWAGRVGVVTHLLARGGFDPSNTTAFVCGPEVMMRFGVKALNEQGVANDQIYVSLERNMKCALGFCGHCQFGPNFICKDGPIFRFDTIQSWFDIREL